MGQVNDALIENIVAEVKKIQEGIVPVGVSNRHVHLNQQDLYELFGEDYRLTNIKDLNQPGQFAAEETVKLKGTKGYLENVRILGPVREKTQIEISISDGFKIGIKPPIRKSGDIKNTPGIIIKGPKGCVNKDEGVIAASRHIHMPKNYSKIFGLKDKDIITVLSQGVRKVAFYNVLVRVSDNSYLEMHIDIDEANSSGLKNGDEVKILINKGVS